MDGDDKKVDNLIQEFFTKKVLDPSSLTPAVTKLLGKMKAHEHAITYINAETSKYNQKLYTCAKMVAESEGEMHIITNSHAKKAKEMVDARKAKYDLSDFFLGLGGLFLGAVIPHIIDLLNNISLKPNVLLIIAGIIGALIFGIGAVFKIKQ